MEIEEAIHIRRAIKEFSSKPIPRQIFTELVDAARHSPSGGNKNPWRFVIITERNTLDQLAQIHPHCRWFASTQAGIALAADSALSRYWLEDCCVAAYSLWLAAVARGLGMGWAAMYQSDDTVESERRQDVMRDLLSIPGNLNIPVVLGIGYPKISPPEKEKPALEEIVYWERYGT